ncbi:hypothetical protein Sj15T_09970 [Sphingobium sp. TA15]|uniref:Uncharacterized protein n=1 Tax=Sphingobium indicum (strain DSM 16413 / CCM 7287 / MTCC 6362 / UT26 / NBRC 101211 / UT26S) TaxID=452662 RepID=D4Z8R8_SPHIU|nr:hypothetical protein [Sphingobium indicum]BAI99000.1 hypothetical protein SJA_P1-00480 [Sphingobium indicum UT26S]BDD65976.1 hypothetical protein Sj15T_09970 [Sphingobium sp. TA15]
MAIHDLIEAYIATPAAEAEQKILRAAQLLGPGCLMPISPVDSPISRSARPCINDAVNLVLLAWSLCPLDDDAQHLFHDLGMAALARLATALGFASGACSNLWQYGEASTSGDLYMFAGEFVFSLTLDQVMIGEELAITRSGDGSGSTFIAASICELLRPDILAARVRSELHYTTPY